MSGWWSPAFRYDVNLSTVFAAWPLVERPAAAAAAGYTAVELWWPFTTPVPTDREADALLTALKDSGVSLVSLNLDQGDASRGDRGLLSIPDQQGRFADNLDAALGVAQQAGCRIVNALYGNRIAGVASEEQDELALANYTTAALAAEKVRVTVVVEALNSFESPDYPITALSCAEKVVLAVRERAGTTNVGLLLDVYHVDRMTGDAAGQIRAHGANAVHVQLADNPGRGRPGTGGIDFGAVLRALSEVKYIGHLGLEYLPRPGVSDDLMPAAAPADEPNATQRNNAHPRPLRTDQGRTS